MYGNRYSWLLNVSNLIGGDTGGLKQKQIVQKIIKTSHHCKKVGLKTQTSYTVEFDITAIPQCEILFTKILHKKHCNIANLNALLIISVYNSFS